MKLFTLPNAVIAAVLLLAAALRLPTLGNRSLWLVGCDHPGDSDTAGFCLGVHQSGCVPAGATQKDSRR